MPIPSIPSPAPLIGVSQNNNNTTFQGTVDIAEANGATSKVPRIVAKLSMSTNSSIPTQKTELIVSVDETGWFGIPKNTLTSTNDKDDVRIKLAFGANFPQPDRAFTLSVETESGVVLWKTLVAPRFVGRNPSDISQCFEIDGWLRGSGGTPQNTGFQSHLEWRLLGYQTASVNDDFQFGSGGWEQFLSGQNFNTTIDNPLKVYIQWEAMRSYWCVEPIGFRNFGISSETGCLIRTSNRGINFNPAKTASYAEIDGGLAYGVAGDGIKVIVVGAGGYIGVSNDGGKTFTCVTKFGSQDLHDIVWAEGLGLWVVVGNAGTIGTSPDGRIWTARTSNVTADIWKIKYNATAGLVAVANITVANNVTRSINGTTWTSEMLASGFSPRCVGLNGANILVGGSNGKLEYWNGSSWSPSTAGSTTLLGAVYSFGRWTVAGSAGALYYSASGTGGWSAGTWTGGNSLTTYDLEGNGTVIVSCGAYGWVYYSTDGITFTKASNAYAGYIFGDIGRVEI